MTEFRANMLRVGSDFSATPFKEKISNAKILRVHTVLVIGGPQGAKPKREAMADILAGIKDAKGLT